MKGFLTGLGMGAAIGLWLAPEAGRETRKKLIQRGADLAQRFDKRSNGAPGGEKAEQRAQHGPGNQMAQPGMSNQAEDGRFDQELPSTDQQQPSTQDEVAEILNTASKTKLRSVPGIGDATARRIIENRPFESEAEVVEANVIPENVLKKLKDKLVEADEEVA